MSGLLFFSPITSMMKTNVSSSLVLCCQLSELLWFARMIASLWQLWHSVMKTIIFSLMRQRHLHSYLSNAESTANCLYSDNFNLWTTTSYVWHDLQREHILAYLVKRLLLVLHPSWIGVIAICVSSYCRWFSVNGTKRMARIDGRNTTNGHCPDKLRCSIVDTVVCMVKRPCMESGWVFFPSLTFQEEVCRPPRFLRQYQSWHAQSQLHCIGLRDTASTHML